REHQEYAKSAAPLASMSLAEKSSPYNFVPAKYSVKSLLMGSSPSIRARRAVFDGTAKSESGRRGFVIRYTPASDERLRRLVRSGTRGVARGTFRRCRSGATRGDETAS